MKKKSILLKNYKKKKFLPIQLYLGFIMILYIKQIQYLFLAVIINAEKYSILINSFFCKFPKQKIRLIWEIIKISLNFDYNVQKTYKYINTELKISCSQEIIRKVFKEMRRIISKYIMIEYESGKLWYNIENKFFSCDECNIVSIGNKNIWLLGIIDN